MSKSRFEGAAARAATMVAVAILGACGGSTSPAAPVVASITIRPASATLDALGDTAQLVVAVADQHGEPMTGAPLTWSSSNVNVATVSAGLLTAVGNGSAQVTVASGSVQAHVSVTVAQAPRALVKVSGDAQSGAAGQPLAAPLVVQVNDRLGHPVSGVAVQFAAAAGNGSIAPASVATAGTGRASATWALGATTGTQHAAAHVSQLDSAVFTASAQQAGSPPAITAVAPDTLIEGGVATITGTNFGATPGANVVTIDGAAATVSSASATRLTVVVPSFSCQPARLATVTVQVGQQSARGPSTPLRPAAMLALTIGQEAMIQDPARFCLELAAAGGGETYVIGLSAPAEVPGAVLPFVTTTRAGMTVNGLVAAAQPNAARIGAAAAGAAGAAGAGPRTIGPLAARWVDRASAEARLRQWEHAHLPALAAERVRLRGAAPAGVRSLGTGSLPAVGDTLALNVPNATSSDPCNIFTPIHAVVRVVGASGIWVEDVANPTADSLTLADIQSASSEFDSRIYATDTSYFGAPSDVDGNQRVIVVLTWQVNRASRILGFVFGGDLFPSGCPESNDGELYYGQVPDPGNVAGTGARTKANVVAEMPSSSRTSSRTSFECPSGRSSIRGRR